MFSFNDNKPEKMICEISKDGTTKVCITEKDDTIADTFDILGNFVTILTFIFIYVIAKMPRVTGNKLSGINKLDLKAIQLVEKELDVLRVFLKADIIKIGLVRNGDFLGKVSLPNIKIFFTSKGALSGYDSRKFLDEIPLNKLTKEELIRVDHNSFDIVCIDNVLDDCKGYLQFIEAEVIARRALKNVKNKKHSYYGILQVQWDYKGKLDDINIQDDHIERQFQKIDFLISKLIADGGKAILPK